MTDKSDYRRKKSASIMLILSGLFLVINTSFSFKVKSENDLTVLNGSLRHYSFVENNGLRNHTYQYFLYLDNHNSSFQIIAELANEFNRSIFENLVNRGDSIQIQICKADISNLDKNKKIRIYGIISGKTVYLDPILAIRKASDGLKFGFYGGLIFILVGSVMYLTNKQKTKRTTR